MLFPKGTLSEESRNKEFRNIRKFHTRKISRAKSNEDLIHGLLFSSDPFINSLRKKVKLHRKDLLNDKVLELIDDIEIIDTDKDEDY